MTISASPGPAHGTLGAFSTDNGFTFSATYTPDDGYTGADAFTLRASDGALSSEPEPVALTITANHAPSCEDALWHGKVATTLRIYLFCSDHDLQDQEDGLGYSAVAGSGPAHGDTRSSGSTSAASNTSTTRRPGASRARTSSRCARATARSAIPRACGCTWPTRRCARRPPRSWSARAARGC